MPFYKGEKWACYSCTKGHRSSKCTHVDRILYKVRKPGRPLNNCPHVIPDMMPAGTFVNTSAESMANGQPPREACDCKQDMVQVAIPKVKSCSCVVPGTTSTISPHPQSQDPKDIQSGVKKGRITKRPSGRRRKSAPLEDATDAAQEINSASVVPASPTEQNNGERLRIIDPKQQFHPFEAHVSRSANHQQSFNFMKGLVPREEVLGDRRASFSHLTPELSEYWTRPARVSDAHTVTPPIGGIDHLSLAQNGDSTFSSNHSPTAFNNSYNEVQSNGAFTSFPKQNFYPTSNLASIPQESVPVFSNPNYHQLPAVRDGNIVKQHHHTCSQPSTPTLERNEASIRVDLSPLEWRLIQQIRTAKIDMGELAKFIAKHQSELGFNFGRQEGVPSVASSANSPYTSVDSAQSSPPPINGATHSNGKMHSPPPPVLNTFPSPGGDSCCAKRKRTEPAASPGSPRCKCGDACRCVPCADHPHNPAMLAHIRENMDLMGESSQHLFGTPPVGWYEDEDPNPAPDAGDFVDFVICDYQYSGGCREGTGGCKCGEGCTCLGCLTHGGHDGVPWEMQKGKGA